MKQVELTSREFNVSFSYEQRDYDALLLKEVKNSTMVFTAIKNGMKYTTIRKKMQFDDEGNVFISFGKGNNLNVGTYKETL